MVGCDSPAAQQCFTSGHPLPRAAPQCISGRTSYLRFRLAFHPYPHVIRAVCNPHRFGPPRPVTGASPCTWVAQAVSGLRYATHALFRLAFAVAPANHCLNQPRTVTRRIILQKARCQRGIQVSPTHSTARTQTGSGSVSLPSPGCFSPFPHGTVRYRSLGVACLGEWAPQLHTTLPVCGATQEQRAASLAIHLPGCHGLWRSVPNCFDFAWQSHSGE